MIKSQFLSGEGATRGRGPRISCKRGRRQTACEPTQAAPISSAMQNHLRTFTLLAGLTALFIGVGYLIGGPTGMVIALCLGRRA